MGWASASILDTTESQYERVMDINLKSAFFGTQIAAKQMIAQGGGGRIINMTSVHEDWPMPGKTAYCLSKGGMRMLTRTAGVELGPHGVTVVSLYPGMVRTEKVMEAAQWLDLSNSESPEFVGRAIAALAGDPDVLRHTGQVLVAAGVARDYGVTAVDGNKLTIQFDKAGEKQVVDSFVERV